MQKQLLGVMAVACLQTALANNINVPAGGNLQAALNAAQPGDTVVLAAGASYVGHFYLPPNPSSLWITIQSSAMSSLPAAGNRVSAANSPSMPKLVTPDGAPALAIGTGANYYRMQGIEFAPAANIYAQDVVQIGNGGEASNSQLPHDLDFDRDYIHGDSRAGSKRGVALNGGTTTIENSYISGFISTGQDTQAICGWNGPGPYTITNNYLEAGSEIVAFGGAAVNIYGNIPSDIVIKNNTFFKPLNWRPGDSSYAGTPVWAKNHIELKNAQRVTIDSNTFTNNWIGADQQGFIFVFGVRTEGGSVPWAVVNNITLKNNAIRHSAAGALFAGHDGASGRSGGFLVQNNVWEDISGNWTGDGRLFEILNGVNGITFDHNTAFQTGWVAVFDQGTSYGVNLTNNIFMLGAGVEGNGQRPGIPTLSAYTGGGVFVDNVLIGNTNSSYPATTFFPTSIAQVGFVDYSAENFLLASGSPYKSKATDGSDIGSSLQTFTVTPPSPAPTPVVPTGWVNIVSKNSSKCLADPAGSMMPGTSMIQWYCNGYDDQKFQFTAVSGGYQITSKRSGLTLEILGGPAVTWNGGLVGQWYYWGGTSQIWQVSPTSDGYFNLKPTHDGLCLDVNGMSRDDGAVIQQWSCWSGDNQKWSFIPAP